MAAGTNKSKPLTPKKVINSVPVSIALYVLVIGGIVWGAYIGAQAMGYRNISTR